MKKGEIYEGVIEKVDYPNKGYVFVDDQKVVVKNGIPGQKVRFVINKKRSGRAEGRLLEVLEKSPLEMRKPVCSSFPACGGCMYQTMPYQEQLRMKECQIKSLLDQAIAAGGQTDSQGRPDYIWEGIHGSPIEFGYRNKMEFSFGDEYKDGPLSLGLHKKGSTYDVLNTGDCKLVHEDMTKILTCVWKYFHDRGISYYKKMQHVGYLRHLLLRRGVTTGEILVHVITTSQEEHDLEPLKEELLNLSLEGKIVGIMHIINDSLSDVVRSDETRILYGQDYFYETLLGLRFKISTFSFFQPNSLAAEVLYSIVRDYIGNTKDMEVFDLYSGTGTIAQLLAPVAKEVIGVEIVEEAVDAARENAALNGLANCRFIAGDVLKVLDEVAEKPDMIVLDPPRDGIHPKALPKIIAYGVEHIVYISCKATSLARDLEAFLAAGYRVERACCVDQFCETVHVETICKLSRKSGFRRENMILTTERLILRPWTDADAESLFEYASDPDVGPIAGWPPHKNAEESLGVIRNVLTGAECYAICEKGSNKAIGAVELKLNGHTDMTESDDECELGYWLGKPFWGRGYMPEAAAELIRHGFEDLGMTTIWCGYYDGNNKSRRVQEKLGFTYHHTCDEVPVPLMHETRIGHTNYMTKEQWMKIPY